MSRAFGLRRRRHSCAQAGVRPFRLSSGSSLEDDMVTGGGREGGPGAAGAWISRERYTVVIPLILNLESVHEDKRWNREDAHPYVVLNMLAHARCCSMAARLYLTKGDSR